MRVKDRESKQRQNNNENVARPEKENEAQKTTVGLRSGSVPPQQLGSGPCLSSFDGLSVLSLPLPGEQVSVGVHWLNLVTCREITHGLC